MRTSKTFCITALLLLAAAVFFPGCSEKPEIIPEEKPGQTAGTYTMSVTASKGEIATRALHLEGSTLRDTWTQGERVQVYNKTRNAPLEGYLEAQGSGASTTLKGSLKGTVDARDELTLASPDPAYGTQDGTLDYIAAHCWYASAAVTVKSVTEGNIVPTAEAVFTSRQAIVALTLLESDGTAISPGVSRLLVTAGGTEITVTPASATNVLYVAVPAVSGAPLLLEAADPNGAPRSYGEAAVTFEDGAGYRLDVMMDCLVTDEAGLRAAFVSEVPLVVAGADISLTSGEITVGGAVSIDLNGHTLSGNRAGRLFSVPAGASLTVTDGGTGGTLTGGKDSERGGAIYNAGTLTVRGGAITGNEAPRGGGIYNDGTLRMSGAPVVDGNAGGNVYLPGERVITVDGAFSEGARIGVSMAGRAGTITSGYAAFNGTLDPILVFRADDGASLVSLRDGEAVWAPSSRYEVLSERSYAGMTALLSETGFDLSAVKPFLGLLFPNLNTPARVIAYTYDSVDPQGNPVTLSALVYVSEAVLNKTKALSGVCLASHVTIASNAECPTEKAQFEGALAWRNYAVVMPDYYGFGVSADRPQAYLDAETTARGNIDAYLSAVRLLEDREVAVPDRLYSFGYSQGGFNAMANVKYVSEHPELGLGFGKAICGGSPFDIGGTWNEYVAGSFRNVIAFVPMTVVSFNETQRLGLDYSRLFKGVLLDNWQDWILSKQYTTSEIGRLLGTRELSDILDGDLLAGKGEAARAILEVCRRNSLTGGWTPPAGTKFVLFHSEEDDTVPFVNLAAMRTFLESAGVDTADTGRYLEYTGKYGNHVNAVISYILAVLNEFS